MSSAPAYSLLMKKEKAHDDPIYCCVWTKINACGDTNIPSKDLIVTGGLDCLIKVWMFNNNKLEIMQTLRGHVMAVISIAVSPDGFTLASTSLDGTLIIWDLLSGQKVHEVVTNSTDVWQVAFSPDGSHVVSGGHNGQLIVYGVENGKKEMVLDTRGKFAMSVAWSADYKYIASGAVDGTVCIFDVEQGKLLHSIAAHTMPVKSVCFSPNSRRLVTGSDDGFVKVFDAASSKHPVSLPTASWCVATVSGDGSRVATAADNTVTVANIDELATLHQFTEHTETIWDLKFNTTSNKLVSVSKDQSINIYDCPVLPKNPAKK